MKPTQSGLQWLYARMEKLGYASLEEVAREVGINKGNLYRYFSFETRPSIDLLPRLCHGLKTSPKEMLQALGITFDGRDQAVKGKRHS